MLNVAYGILVGSLVAILYVPLFIVFYRQYFHTFDQHKLRHVAHSVEASLISSDYSNLEKGGVEYINTYDYYNMGRRHSYKTKTKNVPDKGSKITLYYISNPAKAREISDVGGKEYIPLLKIYIISWIYSMVIFIPMYIFHIDINSRILHIVIISLLSQFLTYMSFSGIHSVMNFIKKVVYDDDITEVEATLVKKGKEGVVSDYVYQYDFNGRKYYYKIKSIGNEPENIKLYIDGSPRKAKDKEVVGKINDLSWSKVFIVAWVIISLVLFIIFIR